MNKSVTFIINIFLCLLLVPSLASAFPWIDFYETWSANEGTTTDAVIWTDDDIDFEVNGITNYNADFVCFDWNSDGTFDNCYYDEDGCGGNCTTESCNYYAVPYNMNDNWKAGCNVEEECREGTQVPERVCDGCNGVDTSNIQDTFVDAAVYYDCDNSQNDRHVDDLTPSAYDVEFFVVYPKKYDCDEGTGDDKSGTGFYDFEGKFSSTTRVDIKSDVACPAYRVCDHNSAHQYYDDQEVISRTGSIPSPCTLENGATSNHICTVSSECYSGNCGGGKTEEKYVCVSDGGNNYDDMFRVWSKTCGGAGYANNWYVETTLSCTAQSGAGYVCDADHDEQSVVNPSTPSSACRKNLDESCSVTTDCWNDDGGNWCNSISKCTDGTNGRNCGSDSDCTSGRCDGTCMAKLADGSACDETSDCINSNCISGYCGGPPPTYCIGSIEVLTEDSSGAPLSGLSVYWNTTYNGTTDSIGQRILNLNVTCSSDQNVTVKCSDNSTVCGTQLTQININGDTDYLYFECAKCSLKSDLYISQSDVYVNIESGKVNVTVHSTGITSNVLVALYREDANGIIQDVLSDTISITAGSEKNATFSLSGINSSDYLHIYVDSNNAVKNEDETNNYVFRAAVKPVKAYVDVKVDPSVSVLNSLIKDYISSFVEPVQTTASADVIIIAGNPYFSNSKPFTLGDNEIVGSDGKTIKKDYGGIVVSGPYFENQYSTAGKPFVLAYGNGIEGDIAAVKRLVNARSIFLDKGAYSRYYTSYIDDYDTLGISVMDLMHNNESQAYFRRNSSGFSSVVRKILFDNNFEVAVKSVKTLSTTSYGNSIILRVKNVNSDFSASYKDAIGISNFPVVFSGGIFSHLTAWEENNGLAKQMAGEGWDVWEIEMNGGPETDCSSSDIDICPNYTYSDLTDFYWPALISGVQKYSGKNQVDYVGHSNGCRAALSSLNSYSAGKNNSGYYFNYNTGQYLFVNLSANPVRKFVGVACPTTLNDVSDTSEKIRELKNGVPKGDLAIRAIFGENLKHIKRQSYAGRIDWRTWFIPQTNDKISSNLMKFYNNLSIDTNTQFTISPNIANNLYLFAGTKGYLSKYEGDGIVPLTDMQNLSNVLNNSVLYLINENHGGIVANLEFMNRVKGSLK